MLVYGVVSPHAPVLLPEIGGEQTKTVQKTINALKKCGKAIERLGVDHLFVISPHTDHGFGVPLYYLQGRIKAASIKTVLVGSEDYSWYYSYGKEVGKELQNDTFHWTVIASADLSHVLKTNGPYQFHPNGPKLDALIQAAFKKNDPIALLDLDRSFIADAAECGLRSILFLLGAFSSIKSEAKKQKVKTHIFTYQRPWGVGYMVADIKSLPDENE